MDNALRLLPDSPPEAYVQTLKRGQVQLDYLRKNPDKILTVSEQNDRKAMMEAEQKKVDLANAKKEEEREQLALAEARRQTEKASRDARNKQERSKEILRQAEIKQRKELAANARKEESPSAVSTFVDMLALGLVGYMASYKVSEKEDSAETPTQVDLCSSHIAETAEKRARSSISNSEIEPFSSDKAEISKQEALPTVAKAQVGKRGEHEVFPELKKMEDLSASYPVEVPEMLENTSQNDELYLTTDKNSFSSESNADLNLLNEEDRIELA
eukprot:CAMPEP_0195536794 /NCGR_PEP_ID=MMETSP0794_2-20130614/46726_1 /TAXON_ID=515487 /ORGANISM="Stephanopyxis turris, Strain CCMP 815" /LENGTH=271 /DNA_ID=CAMNT_0040670319 /DNA_START=44 /DNA_END=855 /DNA_ORIENTATION=+